jgi:maltose O-acetyltransferase
MTEKEKMLRGDLYAPSDPELVADRLRARKLLHAFNASPPDDADARRLLLRDLFAKKAKGLWIEPPFFCDYGEHITFGENVFMNFNCVILDCAPVSIGSRVMFAPAVQIYAATHPMNAAARASGTELAKPVTIGDDVWIGGGAIICPGVTVGNRVVIGAGAVVTRDVPDDVFVAGNPARVVKPIER